MLRQQLYLLSLLPRSQFPSAMHLHLSEIKVPQKGPDLSGLSTLPQLVASRQSFVLAPKCVSDSSFVIVITVCNVIKCYVNGQIRSAQTQENSFDDDALKGSYK